MNFSKFNQNVTQILYNKRTIEYDVKDKPFTSFCDYTDCEYFCSNEDLIRNNYNTEKGSNNSTLDISLFQQNFLSIVKQLQFIFKDNNVNTVELRDILLNKTLLFKIFCIL